MGLLVRQPDRAALDHACAAWLARRLDVHPGSARVFGVCGGRSVEGIFTALARRTDVHWPGVHLFLVDERVVPPADADSNLRQLRAALVDALAAQGLLPEENVHGFRFPERSSAADGAAVVDACNAELQALGGRFDALLLSAGEDGHVASLFPDHASIDDPSVGFFLFDDAPKAPPRRVSASRSLLLRSHCAALVFAGESKRAALSSFIACSDDPGALDIRRHPACLVRSLPEWAAFTDLDDR